MRDMFRRFRENQLGATAVEFAIVLPIMLVTFGSIVESARLFWNYQAGVAGIRDAARFMARTLPEQICTGSTTTWQTVTGYSIYTVSGNSTITPQVAARRIIERNVAKDASYLKTDGLDGQTKATLPTYVTLGENSVRVQYTCVAGAFRTPFAPVVRVSADLVIALPFAGLFKLVGNDTGTVTTTISDQSRVMGL